MRPATLAIHAGAPEGPNSPLVAPIVTSSTYHWDSFEDPPHYEYSRYGNPNREALERTVAALEGAKFAVAFSSGMAALTAASELVHVGDHVLVAQDIYGGTFTLGEKILPRHGVEVSSFDPTIPGAFAEAIRPSTKLAFFESPTNPTLRLVDIKAIADVAEMRCVTTVVDNTFATPLLQNPLALGIDIVVHSTTKYLGGHSDVVGGVAATNSEEIHSRMLAYAKAAGGVPSPFDCWLVSRGIKTLPARMRVVQENAARLAQFLSTHPQVHRVDYPGLETHPGHDIAKRQMKGFGGMVSFVLEDAKAAIRCAKNFKLVSLAASLGGVETLVSYPPVLSHKMLSEEQRRARGIEPGLLRVSVGLEDSDDVIEDFDQALRTGL